MRTRIPSPLLSAALACRVLDMWDHGYALRLHDELMRREFPALYDKRNWGAK